MGRRSSVQFPSAWHFGDLVWKFEGPSLTACGHLGIFCSLNLEILPLLGVDIQDDIGWMSFPVCIHQIPSGLGQCPHRPVFWPLFSFNECHCAFAVSLWICFPAIHSCSGCCYV